MESLDPSRRNELEAMMPIKEKSLGVYKKVRVILYEDKAGVIKFLSVMPRRQK